MTPSEKLLARLDLVRQRSPGRWMVRCPAHDDKTPSLSIDELDDGRVLINCLAGCRAFDVVRAVDLELSDLYPDNPQIQKGRKPRFNYREILEVAKHETMVVTVALDRLLRGELTNEDIERLRSSLCRLRGILGVC